MKLPFASSLIVIAHLMPGLHATPMPVRESCSCQPLEPFTRHSASYNSSLASCNRIAKEIERWRWPLHSSQLADAFVDFSSLELGPGSRLPRPQDRPEARPTASLEPESPRHRLHLKQIERHQIIERALNAGSSRGTYVEAQQRFRIICHPRNPVIEPYTPHTLYSFAAIFIGMALVWLLVFEFTVKLWLRYVAVMTFLGTRLTSSRCNEVWRAREGVIALSGNEKRLYAIVSSHNQLDADLLPSEAGP